MVMKLSEVRLICKKELRENGIDPLDADFILSEILNMPITELFIELDLNSEQLLKINSYIERRKKGEPVSKIFNKAYFYGMELYVDENVLSPRPETELLVEKALDVIKQKENYTVLDLCTGSGAIACAVKINSNANVVAVDISSKALSVAKKNAKKHNLDIKFIKSDMFNHIEEKFDVIISNPPYIETEVCKNLDIEVKNYDPSLALDGGADGLDFYRVIKKNMDYIKTDGTLLLEIGYNQGQKIKELFRNFKVEILKDYNNLDRIAIIKEKK